MELQSIKQFVIKFSIVLMTCLMVLEPCLSAFTFVLDHFSDVEREICFMVNSLSPWRQERRKVSEDKMPETSLKALFHSLSRLLDACSRSLVVLLNNSMRKHKSVSEFQKKYLCINTLLPIYITTYLCTLLIPLRPYYLPTYLPY